MKARISDIDLRLLHIFQVVAESGGFAAAEENLNISRSTISIHIADLETRLGMRLCERSRGRSLFELTAQGLAVYQSVKELLNYLDKFRGQINAIQSRLSGRLKLALPDDWLEMSEASFDLAPVISSYKESAPSVELEIVTRSPHELDFDILNGRADIGINTALVRRPGLVYQDLFSHRSYLYCSKRHPLFCKESDQLTAEEVVEYGLVASSHKVQPETDSLIALFKERASADHMEGCLLLILSGQYIGFLPDYYAVSRSEKYDLRKLLPETFSYSAGNALVFKKNARNNPLVDSFIQTLLAALQQA